MKHSVGAALLALGVGVAAACRLGSSPLVGPSSPLPSTVSSQPEGALTSEVSDGAAANGAAPGPTTASPTIALNPLPVCEKSTGTALANLTLAFAARWDGDNEIYIIQADGSNFTQLTFNDMDDVEPVWSPDGSQLAYVVNAGTQPRLQIAGPNGREGTILAADIDAKPGHASMVWSPTGDQVAFKDSKDLFLADVENGQVLNLTQDEDLYVREITFSVDGRMLAFTAGRSSESDSGRYRLYLINVDSSGLKELRFPEEPVFWPDWHPQSDRILFEGIIPGESVGLYVASLDGTREQLQIQVGSTSDLRAAWSPDGSLIAYIHGLVEVSPNRQRLSRNSLYVATPDGETDLALVEPPSDPDVEFKLHDVVWAPDGRHIAYTKARGRGSDVASGQDLYVVDICDGTSTLVAKQADFYSAPSWRPLP